MLAIKFRVCCKHHFLSFLSKEIFIARFKSNGFFCMVEIVGLFCYSYKYWLFRDLSFEGKLLKVLHASVGNFRKKYSNQPKKVNFIKTDSLKSFLDSLVIIIYKIFKFCFVLFANKLLTWSEDFWPNLCDLKLSNSKL